MISPFRPRLRLLGLPLAALLIAACGGGSGPNWTYAPLGPTPSAGAETSAPTAPPGSPSGSPGTGTTFDVITNDDAPLDFVPNELTMPAATLVTVNYNNNSSLPHNINFFDGTDSSAPSLGATAVVTGPNAIETLSFTTPAAPGDYYFWCDVHLTAMQGIYHVTE
jgi:plastocyanin